MILRTRADWKPRHGQGLLTSGAKGRVVVHHDGHTRSLPGMTVEQEANLMLFYENFHVNGEPAVIKGGRIVTPAVPGLTRVNPRIAYSWVIMQTGRIYEGCGWGRIGAHTADMNSSSYGVFFPLNGAVTAPTADALQAFVELRAEGVRLGHLTADHIVSGHQDHGKPSCPGKLVYDAAVLGQAVVRTLKLGMRGDDVVALQRRLSVTPVSGFFGPVTEQAVKTEQQRLGLKADGVVGPLTRAKWEAC